MAQAQEAWMVADIPRRNALAQGDGVALVFQGRETTWSELDAGSSRVARALMAEGVRPGARVAFIAKDSDALWEAVFGVAKARGVFVGINWRLAAGELGYILTDGGVEVLLAGPDAFAKLDGVEDEVPTIRKVVALGGEHDAWEGYADWRDRQPADDPDLGGDPEDVITQMYTSGTTGRPKGVRLPNRSFFAVVGGMKRLGDPWIGWSQRDVSLSCFPSFHIGGLWWSMTAFNAGATSVVTEAFVAWEVLELIQKLRVTKTCMVPAMIQVLLAEPGCGETDFSSLDTLVYGGSPIPVPLLEEGLATFGCGFAQIYGLTETGNTAVCLRPDDHARNELLKAAGRPYPGVEIKVIDRDGNPVPAGTVGEICIKSPANMIDYWKQPDATASTLIEGWIHTGDAGHVNEEGYVFVSDRVKDMIIYAGENIYPAEIESVLCGHPAIAEAAVIGVPDDRWGELVKAVVVLKPNTSAKAPEIIAHCRHHLADFKVPKSIDFTTTLPRTASGKIRKVALREPYWKNHDRKV